jgi:hypothetical protein
MSYSKLYELKKTAYGYTVVWGCDVIHHVPKTDDDKKDFQLAWDFMLAHSVDRKLGEFDDVMISLDDLT